MLTIFSLNSGLIYELLYGKVFGMEDIDTAIQVMLYEGKPAKENNEVCLVVSKQDQCSHLTRRVLSLFHPQRDFHLLGHFPHLDSA
jgi:hypothetical protein